MSTTLVLDDPRMKVLLKEVLIDLITEKQDLFYEIILEALEEIALGKTIKEGRKNEFVNEEVILALLES